MKNKLKKYLWELVKILRGDHMVTITPTLKCNQKCWYCCQNAIHDNDIKFEERNYQWWIDWIDRNNIRVLSISGGEPSLYPGVEHIIAHCIRKKILVAVITNLSYIIPARKSWRVIFLASYHEGADLERFLINYNQIKDKFVVTVRELHTNPERIIPGSRIIKIIKDWEYGESHCHYYTFAPDGSLFPKDKIIANKTITDYLLGKLRKLTGYEERVKIIN